MERQVVEFDFNLGCARVAMKQVLNLGHSGNINLVHSGNIDANTGFFLLLQMCLWISSYYC